MYVEPGITEVRTVDFKTETQLRQELETVWQMLYAERAGTAVALAKERERCAKVCEDLDAEYTHDEMPGFILEIAAERIRKG